MKSVVRDVQELIDKGIMASDEWASEFARQMGKMMQDRMKPRKDEHKLRLSSLGKCDRYLWYSVRPVEKEELRYDVKLKFLYGDVIELMLLELIKLTGHSVEGEQQEVSLCGIKGHIDAVIDGKVIDVKSTSRFGFKKFQDGTLYKDDPFGYQYQLAAYSEGLGIDAGGWIAQCKESGAVCACPPLNLPNAWDRAEYVVGMVENDNPPERYAAVSDGKSGNEKLCTQCSYCMYKEECWKDANMGAGLRKVLYANGPRWLTKVVKEPQLRGVRV